MPKKKDSRLADLIHELSNPLAVLRAQVDELLEDLESGASDLTRIKQWLTVVSRNVDKLSAILKNYGVSR